MKVLQWRDRVWSKVELEWDEGQHLEDWRDVTERNGWRKMQMFGDEDGLNVEIYERKNCKEDEEPLFFADYTVGSSGRGQMIMLPRWQDLIDFLAHTSTTMLAALLPEDIGMILHDVFENLGWRKEEHKRNMEHWRAERARKEKEKETVK